VVEYVIMYPNVDQLLPAVNVWSRDDYVCVLAIPSLCLPVCGLVTCDL
jgi:hypothetical protein